MSFHSRSMTRQRIEDTLPPARLTLLQCLKALKCDFELVLVMELRRVVEDFHPK